MQEEHRSAQYWICFACREKRRFDEQVEFARHLENDHRNGISAEQIPTFLSACSRSAPVEIKDCPLCSNATSEDTKLLLDHIAEHVHSFSLRSLPWGPTDIPEGELGTIKTNSHDDYFRDNEYFAADSSQGSARNTVSSQLDERDSDGLPELNFEEDSESELRPRDEGELTGEDRSHQLSSASEEEGLNNELAFRLTTMKLTRLQNAWSPFCSPTYMGEMIESNNPSPERVDGF